MPFTDKDILTKAFQKEKHDTAVTASQLLKE